MWTITFWDAEWNLFMILPGHVSRATAQVEAQRVMRNFPQSARHFKIEQK